MPTDVDEIVGDIVENAAGSKKAAAAEASKKANTDERSKSRSLSHDRRRRYDRRERRGYSSDSSGASRGAHRRGRSPMKKSRTGTGHSRPSPRPGPSRSLRVALPEFVTTDDRKLDGQRLMARNKIFKYDGN